MSHSTKIPLDLFQVIEEEFVTLHGTPVQDDAQTVNLADAANPGKFRSVTSTLDWSFHPSHIKDPTSLALDLVSIWDASNDAAKSRAVFDVNADESAQNNLLLYMCNRLGPEVRAAIDDGLRGQGDLQKVLADALNTLLEDPDLFDEARFTYHRLSTKSQALVTSPLTQAKSIDKEDVAQLNRVLLEDAFPDYLERIQEIRLAAIYKRIHQVKPAALCFSGGGIRSGTFALGILQGLARHNLLEKFHYLSTVSGGGYIGSWLAGWIHRHPNGLKGVTSELANTHPRTKVDPDPTPIRFLRRYSSFITPKVGLLTADTWTFLAIYLRNLFLNWMVFIPLLLSVLTLPRLLLTITLAQPASGNQWKFNLRPFGIDYDIFGRHFFLLGGFALTVWALAYIMFNRPTVREELRQYSKFWRSRSTQRSFLVYCLLPLAAAAFCLTTYWAWSSERSVPKGWRSFIIFGLGVSIIAWLIAAGVLGRIRRVFKFRLRSIFTLDLFALLLAGTLGGVVLRLITLLFNPISTGGLAECSPAGSDWSQITWHTELYACFAVPTFMLVFLLGAVLFIGASSASSRVDDEDREWWARLNAWVLIAILGWSVFTTLVIFGPLALLSFPTILASVGGLSGVFAAVLGRSEKTPGAPKSPNQEGTEQGGIMAAIMSKLLPLLAVIFIAALIVGLSLATTVIIQQLALLMNGNPQSDINNWLAKTPPGFACYMNYIYFNLAGKDTLEAAKIAHINVLHYTSLSLVLALGLGLLLLGRLVSRLMNLNIFSLHAGYRNRLIRAFLGASRPDHERKPNPFTGFDPADNLSMHELRAGLFRESDFTDSVALADALLNSKSGSQNNDSAAKSTDNAAFVAAVSKCLNDNDLLRNVERVPDRVTPSTRLLAALRKDLNGALQDPELHTCLAQTSLASEMAPDESYISQNRRALEIVFPNLIRRKGSVEEYRLMPVINTTLNLVGGDNLAWQQRKAEPFSVTPLHAGCFRLGYRDSRLYGGSGGISIGTAAAISGAAASSNMGYYTTSPVLSLVLTFFNVRLGWWLGNPGPAGHDTFQ
ncbi:MAG TPA: patatin-like phospholipase family protein, partial [Pyrinomonadaceae bacterium]|nr:patatin-like phospholipase family protein [Pyrinomonadaceae bacterium]